ncbi:zinc ribbon domain-containing protein [Butyrivibrio sp. FCS014]|uniref:zinc ribbon domain-containing protein n=1 Tax=Butyrivibrio sp. FCS014 TaxID=1408304 RepID=UPI000467D1FD|nr:zinc ribbon domain-containing protein [Butyrivibrio sp. FCS014]
MFCKHCGNELPDDAIFCPKCGKDVNGDVSETIKDKISKASEIINDSAKNAGERINNVTNGKLDDVISKAQEGAKSLGASINDATNGQAGQYAEKARNTTNEFVNDIKDTVKTKDAKNFFTKNHYRNSIITAALVVAIIIFFNIFSGASGGSKQVSKAPKCNKLNYIEVKESKLTDEMDLDYSQVSGRGTWGMCEGLKYDKYVVNNNAFAYYGKKNGKAVASYILPGGSVKLSEVFDKRSRYVVFDTEDYRYNLCVAKYGNGYIAYLVRPKYDDYQESTITCQYIGKAKYNTYLNGSQKLVELSDKDMEKRYKERVEGAKKKAEEETAKEMAEIEAFLSVFHEGEPAYSKELRSTITLKEATSAKITLEYTDISEEYTYEIVEYSMISEGAYACQLKSGFDPEAINSGYGGDGVIAFYNDRMDFSGFTYPDHFTEALGSNPDILPMDYSTGNVFYYSKSESSSEISSDIDFDKEWYKTYTLYEQSGGGHSLEFVWYDDGTADLAIDGIVYDDYIDSESYSKNSDGSITYKCTSCEVIYYPNDGNSVQITKGEYSGYYNPQ